MREGFYRKMTIVQDESERPRKARLGVELRTNVDRYESERLKCA